MSFPSERFRAGVQGRVVVLAEAFPGDDNLGLELSHLCPFRVGSNMISQVMI